MQDGGRVVAGTLDRLSRYNEQMVLAQQDIHKIAKACIDAYKSSD